MSKTNGGIVGYFEGFVSPRIGSAFAWFQMSTINVVVSWVAGIYTLQILNVNFALEKTITIGTGYLFFFYGINYSSMKFTGDFQNFSTFIKLIPLFIIAILGFFYGDPLSDIIQNSFLQENTTHNHSFSWLAALAPMAFSYDGWTVILNVSKDIKSGSRNIPLALFIGPLIVLAAYLAYFIGLIKIVGVNQILNVGDNSIYIVGSRFFGEYGGAVITIFILISVLGVNNGLTIGSVHMPELLASKGIIKIKSDRNVSDKRPAINSMILSLSCSLLWILVHYFTQKFNVFNGGDISELAVTFSYLCYLILYIKIIQLRKNGVLKKF
nr:APC family permease [Enterococcus faecalis]